MARKYVPRSTPSSYTGTMFGWARATVVFASSTNLRTNSSSHASSSRICFTTSFFSNPPAPRNVASVTRAIPPRASSRSRTYLPKTWGYILAQMRLVHHSKCALSLVIALTTVDGCHAGGSVSERVVTTHVSPSCPSGGQALDGEGYAKFYGSGDFEPTLPAAGHFLKSVGDVLSEIDPASRALVVDASEGAGRWLAVSGIPATGNLDVLFLPWMASCALSPVVSSSGATIGPIGSAMVLIAGGVTDPDASQVPAASQVVDLSTGFI